jgi:mRNA interferase RelE/StbE
MTWTTVTGPLFPKDLARLPKGIRERVEEFALKDLPLADNPFRPGKLEKLKGYQNFYKARFGDYRLGLRIDGQRKIIHLLRIMHRREIYRHFP